MSSIKLPAEGMAVGPELFEIVMGIIIDQLNGVL